MNDVELAIRLTADADQASKAALDVGDSFGRMATDVDDATRKADSASSRMDSVADSADNMASRSSQAAGGMGDLGGALALMPGPLGAVGAGMEAVSPAIMGVTGAADLMNLAMSSSIVVQTKAKAAAIAHAVASRTVAAATRVWAAAQWVLNRAFLGNPILLALTAIAVVFVVLYKRSERFRSVVRAVMEAARKAIGWVLDQVERLVKWFRDDAPAAAARMRDRVVAVAVAIREKLGDAWSKVQEKVRAVVDWIREKVLGIRERVELVAGKVKGFLVDAFDAALKPVNAILDAVKRIVDWVGKIDFPDLPSFDIPGVGRRAVTGGGGTTAASSATGPSIYNEINLFGIAASGADVVRQLETMFQRYGMQLGTVNA